LIMLIRLVGGERAVLKDEKRCSMVMSEAFQVHPQPVFVSTQLKPEMTMADALKVACFL